MLLFVNTVLRRSMFDKRLLALVDGSGRMIAAIVV